MANNDRLLVLRGRGDLGIQLSDKAEREINAAIASVSASAAPCMTHTIGMIDMALALDLIGAEQASQLKDQLRRVFNYRRTQLNEQRIARILGGLHEYRTGNPLHAGAWRHGDANHSWRRRGFVP